MADKGKGKAVDEPRQRAQMSGPGPAPTIIQYFAEPDNAPQRGYDQAAFESAWKEVALGKREAIEEEVKTRRAGAPAALKDEWAGARDLITSELGLSAQRAERALQAHDGDLTKTLLQLTAPAAAQP